MAFTKIFVSQNISFKWTKESSIMLSFKESDEWRGGGYDGEIRCNFARCKSGNTLLPPEFNSFLQAKMSRSHQ